MSQIDKILHHYYEITRNPLSHDLFILIMEGLSKMLDKTKNLSWKKGFEVGTNHGNAITISHSLYIDDTLIFCGAKESLVLYLNLTLLIL